MVTVIIPVINYSNGIEFFWAFSQSRIVVLLLLFLRDVRSLYLAVALQSGQWYFCTVSKWSSAPLHLLKFFIPWKKLAPFVKDCQGSSSTIMPCLEYPKVVDSYVTMFYYIFIIIHIIYPSMYKMYQWRFIKVLSSSCTTMSMWQTNQSISMPLMYLLRLRWRLTVNNLGHCLQ